MARRLGSIQQTRRQWPVLRSYDQEHLAAVALPLGGIGTGTVSLGGRGDLRDWEIVNRPAKGFSGKSLFLLHIQGDEDREPVTRVLEGCLQAPFESQAPYAGLPRFRECEFLAAYPFGQVTLSDPDVPLEVELHAFNPLIPGNAEDSGLPVAVLRYVLQNRSSRALRATVCGALENFIGCDGHEGRGEQNTIEFVKRGKLKGLLCASQGVPVNAPQHGTLVLCTNGKKVTYRRSWGPEDPWEGGVMELWDELTRTGRVVDAESRPQERPFGALTVQVEVPPRSEEEVLFILAWHFPNRQSWTPHPPAAGEQAVVSNRVGNFYCTRFKDAWEAAVHVAKRLGDLEGATLAFVDLLLHCDLPEEVMEAALFNLSALRSPTCFRTGDGRFYGYEGCQEHEGCGHGNCTHVWSYEYTTAFLFGELSRSLRETEFLAATDDQGRMSFRANLPLERAREWGYASADGQLGCLMKLYRDWQLSGDEEFLRRLWPKAKLALQFAWRPGSWDADQDGVLEGCQYNTFDVEYFGPNALMQGWYLGALRAVEEMARHLGDAEFAQRCHDLFERGRQWTDQHLFNGQYYQQEVRPASGAAAIAPGLRLRITDEQLANPPGQAGTACQVNQLAGQLMAHVCGLGYLLAPDHVRTTLTTIMERNFRSELYEHATGGRTGALNDEAGLVTCSYPGNKRPASASPRVSALMTGLEYTAAALMLYERQTRNGLTCIKAVRQRYDGRRRNPFNEVESGDHYVRAMAAWAAVPALTGFHYSAVERRLAFGNVEGVFFWSTGNAWGVCSLRREGGRVRVKLQVYHGVLLLERFVVRDVGSFEFHVSVSVIAGQGRTFTVTPEAKSGSHPGNG